jgi:hypothetical protein
VTSSAGALDAARLGDADYTNRAELPVGSAARPAWVQFDFGERQVVHALSFAMAPDNWARPLDRRPVPPLGTVEASRRHRLLLRRGSARHGAVQGRWTDAPEVPEGYSFDLVNAAALAELLSVRDGRLVTASGGDYALLYLGGSSRKVTLRTARKLRGLVRAGAVVVGARPEGSPSLADDDDELESIRDELWGTAPATRGVGSGRVFGQSTLAEALRALDVQPDLDYSDPDGETTLASATAWARAHPSTGGSSRSAASLRVRGGRCRPPRARSSCGCSKTGARRSKATSSTTRAGVISRPRFRRWSRRFACD